MQTLTAITPMEVSTVNAGWDSLEMGSSAQVHSIAIK